MPVKEDQHINRIQPSASNDPEKNHEHNHDHGEGEEINLRRDLFFIITSAALLGLGLIFNSQLHSTPYSWAEYVVILSS